MRKGILFYTLIFMCVLQFKKKKAVFKLVFLNIIGKASQLNAIYSLTESTFINEENETDKCQQQ